ncbi:hypothetical protein Bpfe_017151, partial [Biomphalaria pfeifferi]
VGKNHQRLNFIMVSKVNICIVVIAMLAVVNFAKDSQKCEEVKSKLEQFKNVTIKHHEKYEELLKERASKCNGEEYMPCYHARSIFVDCDGKESEDEASRSIV